LSAPTADGSCLQDPPPCQRPGRQGRQRRGREGRAEDSPASGQRLWPLRQGPSDPHFVPRCHYHCSDLLAHPVVPFTDQGTASAARRSLAHGGSVPCLDIANRTKETKTTSQHTMAGFGAPPDEGYSEDPLTAPVSSASFPFKSRGDAVSALASSQPTDEFPAWLAQHISQLPMSRKTGEPCPTSCPPLLCFSARPSTRRGQASP
jgi:hypothetical protein